MKSVFVVFILLAGTLYASERCMYRKNMKPCNKPALRGEIYCLEHGKEVVESIKRRVNQEMEEEKKTGEAIREGQVRLMAEGMARALGRVPCSSYGCRNYVEQGQRYCGVCEKKDIERKVDIVMEREEKKLYAEKLGEYMEKIPTCKAKNKDGSVCGRKSYTGSGFCSLHTTFQEKEDPIIVTKKRMDEIEKWIEIFTKAERGALPRSLRELNLMSVEVPQAVDGWGIQLYYEVDGRDYALSSAGQDNKFETSDDITVIRRR